MSRDKSEYTPITVLLPPGTHAKLLELADKYDLDWDTLAVVALRNLIGYDFKYKSVRLERVADIQEKEDPKK